MPIAGALAGLLAWFATTLIRRALALFVVVVVSGSLISYIWDQIVASIANLGSAEYGAPLLQLLGLAGLGEFLGIIFGAFVLKVAFSRAIIAAT